jgi:repressor LexA
LTDLSYGLSLLLIWGVYRKQHAKAGLPLPRRSSHLLTIKGDSMKDAGILYGDVVVVERGPSPAPGQIVVAEIDGTTTLKFLRQGRNGTHYLEPANGRYQPIYPERELKVTAVVKGVVRKY